MALNSRFATNPAAWLLRVGFGGVDGKAGVLRYGTNSIIESKRKVYAALAWMQGYAPIFPS